MSHELTFIKGELVSTPTLVCGDISVNNDSGELITLRDPLTQKTLTIQNGEQKVTVPSTPFMYYTSASHQGKIKCEQEGLSLVPVVLPNSLTAVTAVTGVPGSEVLVVATQYGDVVSFNPSNPGASFTTLYQTGSNLVKLDPNYDERGLLDIALGADGRTFMYMCFPPQQPGLGIDHVNCVYELNSRGESTLVTSFPAKNKIHNGGRLLLALPYLFVGTGDGGPQEDPEDNAQNLMVLQGKILRFNVSAPGKPVPQQSNSFSLDETAIAAGTVQRGRPEIYAYGIRNCWGLSNDSKSRVFCADVGYNTAERVNIIEKGGNYGWSFWEGTVPTPWRKETTRPGQQPPIIEYRHQPVTPAALEPAAAAGTTAAAKVPCAIIGGYPVVDGSGRQGYIFADIAGDIYFYYENADLTWKLAWISGIPEAPGTIVRVMGRDGLGQIYIVTAENMTPTAKNSIYRLQGI